MNEVVLTILGAAAALLNALILMLLTLIFNAIKQLRETFKEYVPNKVCALMMKSNTDRLEQLEKRLKDVEDLTK